MSVSSASADVAATMTETETMMLSALMGASTSAASGSSTTSRPDASSTEKTPETFVADKK